MNEMASEKITKAMRLFSLVALATLALILVIAGGGWLWGWRTSTEFSNGFFIAGAVAAVFGAYSAVGGFGMRAHPGVNVARTASPASLEERNRQMFKDMLEGHNFAILLVIVGLLLIGCAILIPNLFG